MQSEASMQLSALLPVVNPNVGPLPYGSISRALDVVVTLLALIPTAPLMLVAAILIKLEDRGPVLFRQQRVGKDGKSFTLWKFRSMRCGADRDRSMLRSDDGNTVRFKMRRDPRITRTGAWLRKNSIDELPQLFNVLRGDMSLVGPRPPIPEEVAQYTPRQRRRLSVKPGLTCLWQVNGRADLPFPEQVELDLKYIRSRCIRLDIMLLLRTVPAVLSGRGAY